MDDLVNGLQALSLEPRKILPNVPARPKTVVVIASHLETDKNDVEEATKVLPSKGGQCVQAVVQLEAISENLPPPEQVESKTEKGERDGKQGEESAEEEHAEMPGGNDDNKDEGINDQENNKEVDTEAGQECDPFGKQGGVVDIGNSKCDPFGKQGGPAELGDITLAMRRAAEEMNRVLRENAEFLKGWINSLKVFDLREYECKSPELPPFVWRVTDIETRSHWQYSFTLPLDKRHTVAGDSQRKFHTEVEFREAVEAHIRWSTRGKPSCFLSVFSDERHARNWAGTRKARFVGKDCYIQCFATGLIHGRANVFRMTTLKERWALDYRWDEDEYLFLNWIPGECLVYTQIV